MIETISENLLSAWVVLHYGTRTVVQSWERGLVVGLHTCVVVAGTGRLPGRMTDEALYGSGSSASSRRAASTAVSRCAICR